MYADDAPKYDPDLFNLNIPIFAICYGFQLMVHVFDGSISRGHEREDGQFDLNIDCKESELFANIDHDQISVLLTHGDIVKSMPTKQGFKTTATSTNGIIAAGENAKLKIYGVQFHPEVDLTPDGRQIFKNFLYNICGIKANYTLKSRMATAIDYIQQRVGKHKKVLCLVSGGVDSSVCTALLQKALNEQPSDLEKPYQDVLKVASNICQVLKVRSTQIYPVHIDHGFMRHNESKGVIEALKTIGIDNVHMCEAQEYFANGTTMIDGKESLKLCQTISPEHKRKIIGDLFIKLCDQIVTNIFKDDSVSFDDMLLVQGTLRPDLIESASKIANKSGTAQVIKTHHNDTALVRRLRDEGKVIEPLTDYHKDEVRSLGTALGLKSELVWRSVVYINSLFVHSILIHRQPFPGPGLAIRIICSDGTPYCTKEDDDIVKKLNDNFANERISCCLLGIQTVGVQGDGRTYAHCIGLTVNDSMKDKIPWKELYKMAKDIPRQILGVNRVCYIYGKALKGKQQDVTPTYLEKNVVDQLRKCDKIVNDKLFKYELISKISQVPVILFPSNFGCNEPNARSICIRTFITNDFMTGVPAEIGRDIEEKVLLEMFEDILKVDGIQRVAFDLTPKPPGTTEWE